MTTTEIVMEKAVAATPCQDSVVMAASSTAARDLAASACTPMRVARARSVGGSGRMDMVEILWCSALQPERSSRPVDDVIVVHSAP